MLCILIEVLSRVQAKGAEILIFFSPVFALCIGRFSSVGAASLAAKGLKLHTSNWIIEMFVSSGILLGKFSFASVKRSFLRYISYGLRRCYSSAKPAEGPTGTPSAANKP